jgi:glyoxylate/hydroxypyruvate reductase
MKILCTNPLWCQFSLNIQEPPKHFPCSQHHIPNATPPKIAHFHFQRIDTMRITLCYADSGAAAWQQELSALLPKAQVSIWASGDPAADYAVVRAPTQQFFDEQPQLKAAFNAGAGVDAVMKLQLPAHTQLVRLDDAGMAAQMAEYVCHTVIRHFREFAAYEADATTATWAPRMLRKRSDFTVGIMGLGVLGERVARAVAQFDFPVVGWSRTPKSLPGVTCFGGAENLNAFLAATRVLVCLVPLTPETRDILNLANLSRLQPQAYVINVARGAHLVDDDLLTLLQSGHVAGATLDVFRTEPLPAGHPFWQDPRITITPHASAHTLRSESVVQIARKIEALERGEPVVGVVDRVRGY